jgi:hypothetical protein
MTASGGIDTSCLAFEPITYSAKDSPVTIQQVRQHNAAFSALCPMGQAEASASLTDK